MQNLATPYLPAPPLPRVDLALYVDFDGVLQHESVMWHRRRGIYMNQLEAPGRTLFEWTHHLEQSLKDFPDIFLVLSSTWCINPGYGKALKRLPESLRSKFVGGTYHKRVHGADPWLLQSFRSTPRWKQIADDVARRKPSAWLALDDDVEDWPDHLRDNLVACDGSTGLSELRVREELRGKLLRATALSRLAHGQR